MKTTFLKHTIHFRSIWRRLKLLKLQNRIHLLLLSFFLHLSFLRFDNLFKSSFRFRWFLRLFNYNRNYSPCTIFCALKLLFNDDLLGSEIIDFSFYHWLSLVNSASHSLIFKFQCFEMFHSLVSSRRDFYRFCYLNLDWN